MQPFYLDVINVGLMGGLHYLPGIYELRVQEYAYLRPPAPFTRVKLVFFRPFHFNNRVPGRGIRLRIICLSAGEAE